MATQWNQVGSTSIADMLNRDSYMSYLGDAQQRAQDGGGVPMSYDDWRNVNSQGYNLPQGADLSQYNITTNSDGSSWDGLLQQQVTKAGETNPIYSKTWANEEHSLSDLVAAAAILFGGGALAAGAGAAGGAAAAGTGAGEAGAGIGTLGAADTGVTALGAGMSPAGLGLTGAGAGAGSAAEALSGLGSLAVPGAVDAGAGLGTLGAAEGGVSALGAGMSPGALGLTEAGSAGSALSGLGSLTVPGAVETGAGLGAAAGAGAGGGSFTPAANYGEGMSGLQTSAYDNTLGMTGSKGIADSVANSSLGSSVWNSPTTKSIADMFTSSGNNTGWMDLIKGGMSLYQASQMSKAGSTPWGQAAGSQLATLLADPSSMTKLPGYEAGLQAVQRSGAANGYLGSGNMMVGLQKYGGEFYNNTLRQLSSIANEGRGIDQQYNFASTALTGHAINNFGYGLTKLFGG